MVLVSVAEWGEDALARTREEFNLRAYMKLRPGRAEGVWPRVRRKLDPKFVDAYGMRVSAEDRALFDRLAGESALVWIHTLRVANALGQYRLPRTVMDLDDLYSGFYQRQSTRERNLRRRIKLLWESAIARRRERDVLNRFTMALVCSEEDRRYLGAGARIRVVPNGFRRPAGEPSRRPVGKRVGFIGKLTIPSNREGMEWFAKEVWPQVKAQEPEARVRVVGDGSTEAGGFHHPDFDGLGYVDEPSEEISTWSVMIVPVFVGAGTRVKVAEALSRRVPLVATSFGCLGYELAHERECLLGDTASVFAAQCVRLLRDQDLGNRLAEAGWRKFLSTYTWEAIAPRVQSVVEDCLRFSPEGRASGAA